MCCLCLWCCLSVEGAMVCQMRFYHMCCAVSVSGTIRSAIAVPLEKPACGGNASLWPADPSLAHRLERPTAACPRSVRHANQKCPQFCRMGRDLDAERAVSCARSTKKKSRGERELENTPVAFRLCRAPRSCSGHKPTRDDCIPGVDQRCGTNALLI